MRRVASDTQEKEARRVTKRRERNSIRRYDTKMLLREEKEARRVVVKKGKRSASRGTEQSLRQEQRSAY